MVSEEESEEESWVQAVPSYSAGARHSQRSDQDKGCVEGPRNSASNDPLVYKLTNTVNGKGYVGKAVDSVQRMYEHKSGKKKRNGKLQCIDYAIQKYGWDKFKKEWLETNIPRDELLAKEAAYIREHNTMAPNGYNILKPGVEVVSMQDPDVRARWEASKPTAVLRMIETKQENREKRLSAMDAREAEALRYRLETRAIRERKRYNGEDHLMPNAMQVSIARREATWERKLEERLAKMSPRDARNARAKYERAKRYKKAKKEKDTMRGVGESIAPPRPAGGLRSEGQSESEAESEEWFLEDD